jgi:hypothetical protein
MYAVEISSLGPGMFLDKTHFAPKRFLPTPGSQIFLYVPEKKGPDPYISACIGLRTYTRIITIYVV